ncbi:hypothetical protein ACVWYF_003597 [Hymenobacter sp. UYAg731]
MAEALEIYRCLIAGRHFIVLTVNANGRIPSRLIAGESGAHKKALLLCGKRAFGG